MAAEALGAHKARALPLLGLVSTARAFRALLVAVAANTSKFAGRANVANFAASAFVLEVLPGIARDRLRMFTGRLSGRIRLVNWRSR